jgi:hypothetical protein
MSGEYLEAHTIDMFYRFSQATRTPTIHVVLPGNSTPVITQYYTPTQWAAAFYAGFQALVTQFSNPLNFQTYTLRRAGLPAYPNPSFKPVTRGEPRPPRADTTTGDAPSPGNSNKRTCFMIFLRHYKIAIKSTGEVPKACETTCNRLHYAQLPKGYLRATAADIATKTTLVSDENRIKLHAAIAADSKFK